MGDTLEGTVAEGTLVESLSILVCPRTPSPLTLGSADEAEARLGAPLVARTELPNAKNQRVPPVGRTEMVLLALDRSGAYPVVDGIPILLAPERLTRPDEREQVDL